MKTTLLRGVPASLQQDGWWLSGDVTRMERQVQTTGSTRIPLQLIVLVGMIVLADVLVWQVVPGASLAVFGAALVCAALALKPGGVSRRLGLRVGGGTLLAVLPLVELVQPLSLGIAFVGLTLVLAIIAGVRTRSLGRATLAFWPAGVRQGARDLRVQAGQLDQAILIGWFRTTLKGWAMPLGVGMVFVLLLFAANPVAQAGFARLQTLDPATPDMARLTFWMALVPIVWAVLSAPRLKAHLSSDVQVPAGLIPPMSDAWINPLSIARALVLFNLVFAMQTGMDMVYLYGGVSLPDGITHAEYAHRGAYPLIVTALLAGGFALLCQAWVQDAPVLRALLLLWVAQNVALVISSEVRLSLYVDVYGLTRLRLAAGIWMVLVAAGLLMIMCQICLGRSNAWLLARLCALGVGVLYLCAWISFDGVIARYNLSHDVKVDRAYLCDLGDGAQPFIAAFDANHETTLCRWPASADLPQDWREWGFRNWRARHSLNATLTGATP